jgi:hypothetical protein
MKKILSMTLGCMVIALLLVAPKASADVNKLDISGSWYIIANDYRGTAEFVQNESTITGIEQGDTVELGNLSSTNVLTFRRGNSNPDFVQYYTGAYTFDKKRVLEIFTGTFTMVGAKDRTYKWTAYRRAPDSYYVIPETNNSMNISGSWDINANGYWGKAEFIQNGSSSVITGTEQGTKITLGNLSSANVLTFRRDNNDLDMIQDYTGTYSVDKVKGLEIFAGTFSMSGSGDNKYNWSATRKLSSKLSPKQSSKQIATIVKIQPLKPVIYTTSGAQVTNVINGILSDKTKKNISKEVKLTASNKNIIIYKNSIIKTVKKGTTIINATYKNLKTTYKVIIR